MLYDKTSLNFNHAFSNRLNGVSINEFYLLNLGFNYGDDIDNVYKNWEIFESNTFKFNTIFYANQVHENKVKVVSKDDIKKNKKFIYVGEYDAIVTDIENITLAIFTADCIPLLLMDKKNKVCACVHCGWKPLTKDIIKNVIDKMMCLEACAENTYAAIGPGIGQCCFETNNDVYDALLRCLGESANKCSNFDSEKNKYYIDLQKAVKIRLIQLGIKEKNIQTIRECTSCNSKKYFSYRHDNGKTGRMASVVQI